MVSAVNWGELRIHHMLPDVVAFQTPLPEIRGPIVFRQKSDIPALAALLVGGFYNDRLTTANNDLKGLAGQLEEALDVAELEKADADKARVRAVVGEDIAQHEREAADQAREAEQRQRLETERALTRSEAFFYFLRIAAAGEGLWEARVLLSAEGRGSEKSLVALDSEHSVGFRITSDADFIEGAVVSSWKVLSERQRRAPRESFPDRSVHGGFPRACHCDAPPYLATRHRA